jgi:hypothetical protein
VAHSQAAALYATAILTAIGCPDIVTGRFPTTLAGFHPVCFPGDTHPHSSHWPCIIGTLRTFMLWRRSNVCDWPANRVPAKLLRSRHTRYPLLGAGGTAKPIARVPDRNRAEEAG